MSRKNGYNLKCGKCFQITKLQEFAHHSCEAQTSESPSQLREFVPVLEKVTKNRSTFSCPFCTDKNLLREDLVEHVSKNHKNSPPAVCPICVTYPYGDPNFTTYLPGHLKARHGFDLEEIGWATHFNEEESEESVLAKILELSKSIK